MYPAQAYSDLTHKEELGPIFSNDLSLPVNYLKAILELPRESLINDLEYILTQLPGKSAPEQPFLPKSKGENETYERVDKGATNDILPKERSFVIHTLNLLAELRSRRSIPMVEYFLLLPEDELRHWLGPYIELGFWEVLFDLYRNLHLQLGSFLLQPELANSIRIPLLNALAQVAWHLPVYRSDVLKAFSNLIDAILAGTLMVTPAFVGELVREITDLRAEKLLPQIRDLYNNNRVQLEVAGDLNSVEAGMIGPVRSQAKRPDLNIYGRYEIYRAQHRLSAPEDPETAVRLDLPKPSKPGRGQIRSLGRKKQPLKKNPKIGRNQPCPCGSGKKYKHCHGK